MEKTNTRIGIKKTETPTMKHYSDFPLFVLLCLFLFSFHHTITLFALKLYKLLASEKSGTKLQAEVNLKKKNIIKNDNEQQ